eukprot:s470_g9.t1
MPGLGYEMPPHGFKTVTANSQTLLTREQHGAGPLQGRGLCGICILARATSESEKSLSAPASLHSQFELDVMLQHSLLGQPRMGRLQHRNNVQMTYDICLFYTLRE